MHGDFVRHFDGAATTGVNYHVIVGGALTTDGKPYRIDCFAGELFVFELSGAQLSAVGVAANSAKMHSGKFLDRLALVEKPLVTLSRLEVEDEANLAADKPVVANVLYKLCGEPRAPIMARLDYDLPSGRSVRCFHSLNSPRAGQGRLQCSFSKLGHEFSNKPAPFPVAVFLRLFGPPEPPQGNAVIPISNACATLISVSPGDSQSQRVLPPA
jgi:hypothetical protein